MNLIHIRPTHFTFHCEGVPPRFRIQSDEASPYLRLEFAGQAQLLATAHQAERTAQNYFDSSAGSNGAAGVQLQLSQNKLTYDMPLEVWRQLAQNNYHLFYCATATTQSPPNWSGQTSQTVRTVDDGWASRGIAPYIGIPHNQLHDPWAFADMGVLNQVPEFYRSKLQLMRRYDEAYEGAYLLRRLSGHNNYTSLPENQRVKALLAFAAGDNPARRALVQLFERVIPGTTSAAPATPAVQNQDLSPQHNTLLDNLARLVEIDPHMEIAEKMDVLVGDLIEEVSDPSFELNQGTKGTCVPTSAQWIITTYFPAEYVRLMLTLFTQQGQATIANGDVARVPSDAYQFDPAEQSTTTPQFLRRSWSERLFQSSMMAYARPGLTYSNIQDVFNDRQEGLFPDELVRLISGLRNRLHASRTGSGTTLLSDIAQRFQSGTLPILTTMLWGPPTNQGRHEVVTVQIDASNLTIRNPWGRVDYRVGQAQQDPPRTCTNPMRGEETMTRADTVNWITDIVVEQN
jgi:hypothetical protein